MPRDPATGVFTRTPNSFSDPIDGTVIDPSDANAYYADIDIGITNALPVEPIVVTGDDTIPAGTAGVAVQRTAPTATALQLPAVADQNGVPLTITDWSTAIASSHVITLTPDGSETILLGATYSISSSDTQLGAITLYPSTTLNGWYDGSVQAVTLSNLPKIPANTVVANVTGATAVPTAVATSGTGNFVRTTSPTLVTPTLGVATATSVNGSIVPTTSGDTLVGKATTDTLTNKTIDTAGPNTIKVNGNTLAASAGTATVTVPNATTTLVGRDTTDTLTNKTYDTAGTGNSLSINGVAVTANTGTGAVARAASPTFTTPTLGAATATTINGNTFTAGTYTLTGTAGKTLTFSNSLTLAGTDGTTQTFPSTSGTVVSSVSSNVVTNAMAAQAGSYTFKGNPTGSTANVQDFTIAGLTHKTVPTTSDLLLVTDVAAGNQPKYSTIAEVVGAIGTGVTSFNARVGAVVPASADYTAAQIGSTGVFYKVVPRVFTSSGTYTPSTGLVYAIIECVGGGGGGGGEAGSTGNADGAGGGGSGGYSRLYASAATIGASKTVTIGAAGSAGSAGNNAGGAGGDTSVGSICIAKGGSGGSGSAGIGGTGGAGGVAGTGDLTTPGARGGYALSIFANSPATGSSIGGAGANSIFGQGGAPGGPVFSSTSAGGAASGYGAGGGGAAVSQSSGTAAGGAGSAGIVVITEYLNQ